MYALLAIVPILIAIVMMVGFNIKSGISMAAAWAAGFAFAIIFWGLNPFHGAAYTIFGFLVSIDTILIIFGAIFLLNALIELKFIEAIGDGFSHITHDRRIQILIIGWLFTSFIEGAAGFGTPGALAAPLLVGLGVPPFAACLSALIGSSTPTTFGAVGTPPITGFNTIVPGILESFPGVEPSVFGAQFYSRLALTNIFIGTFVPVLLIITIVVSERRKGGAAGGARNVDAGGVSIGGVDAGHVGAEGVDAGGVGAGGVTRSILPIVPMCIYSGLVFTVPVYFIATYIGPEIPSMLGALIGLVLLLAAVKTGFLVPKDIWRFRDDPISEVPAGKKGVPLIKAWSPYVVITALLTLTRLPWLPVKAWINDPSRTLTLTSILGNEGIDFSFKILNNPGIFPFVLVTAAYMAAGKMKPNAVGAVLKKTVRQIKNAVIALLFGVALVQIMRYTNYSNPAGELEAMTTEVAKTLAAAFGGMYPLISPFVGAFGAFVAGSNTVSNIMFMPLQFQAAVLVGLPAVMIAMSQSLGGAIGNMVCVHNVVAVTATTGAEGSEGRLIAAAALPCAIYCLMLSAMLFIYLAAGISWIA